MAKYIFIANAQKQAGKNGKAAGYKMGKVYELTETQAKEFNLSCRKATEKEIKAANGKITEGESDKIMTTESVKKNK